MINMNYSLLMESSDASYKMPLYTNMKPSVFTESFLLQTVFEFNQELRESQRMIDEICSEESINEAGITASIVSGLHNVIIKIRDAFRKIWKTIVGAFTTLIDKIKKLLSRKKNAIEDKYSLRERVKILNNALAGMEEPDKYISICDIEATKELLDKNFPDMNLINDEKLNNDIFALLNLKKSTAANKSERLSTVDDQTHAENLKNTIFNDREELLGRIFGKYDFDTTNVLNSAREVADKAFGSNEAKKVKIDADLYMLTYDNHENLEKLFEEFKAIKAKYDESFKKIDTTLNKINDGLDGLAKYKGNSPNMFQDEYAIIRAIGTSMTEGLNALRTAVGALNILAIGKYNRFANIINNSEKARMVCNDIINKAVDDKYKTDVNSIYTPQIEEIDEFYNIQNDFEIANILMSEAFAEDSFNGFVLRAINEAEGDQQQPQATEAPATQPAGGLKTAGKGILDWLKNIIGKLGDTFGKFKDRFEETVVKVDSKWWNDNKARFYKLQLSDTQISDWYCYNIEYFKNKSYVKFDATNALFDSDESVQNAIIKNITGSDNVSQFKFDEKDTFGQKINKIYSGRYIEKDKPEVISNISEFNQQNINNFLDEFVGQGMGGATMTSITEEYKNLDDDYKKVSRDYAQIADQMKAQQKTTPDTNATDKNAEPQKTQESAVEDDFKFNLAECFGLNVYHEVEVVAGKDAAAIVPSQNEERNPELDAKIKRCFNYNTTALTAKMTACFAAYKQYTGLYKALVKGGNNQQQQQNQNQNNNQNNAEQQPAENK